MCCLCLSHLPLSIIKRVAANSSSGLKKKQQMEKENCQANADSPGVCEKIYNAVAANPAFRAIHRKSSRSHSPMAVITNPNQPGVQTTGNAAKTNVPDPIKIHLDQHKASPGEVHIPIVLGPSMVLKEKENILEPPPSVQNSGRATISPARIEPSGHFTTNTTKENTSQPVSQTQTTKPTTVIVHIEGHVDDVAPKLQLVLPQPQKVKPTIASGHVQWSKVASKKDVKPAVSPSMEEKLRQDKATSPNIIVIQGHDQGIHAPPRAEPSKLSHVHVQEEQPKPKIHAAAVAKTMSTKNDQPSLHNKGDREGKKPEHSTNINDKFSNYITRVKNKMRTPSSVSEETVNASPFTRLATRRDSFNDRVANYINGARNNIRTTSNVGDA